MNRFMGHRLLALFLGSAIVGNHQAVGQTASDVTDRYVPKSAVAAVVLFPQAISGNPNAELFPREIVSAWGQMTLGVDPMSLASVILVLDSPSKNKPPQWGCVFRFAKPTPFAPSDAEQLSFEDKSAFRISHMPDGIFVVADEQTVLLGPETYLHEMLSATKPDNDLSRLIAKEASPSRIAVVVDIKGIRPAIREIVDEFPGQVPSNLKDLTKLHESLDSLSVKFDVDPNSPLMITLVAPDTDAARKVDVAIQQGLEFAKQMFTQQVAAQMDPKDPVQAATIQYIRRIGDHFQDLAKPTVNGNALEYKVQSGFATTGVLVGLLLPAVQSAREAARRVDSMNRVRQLIIAMLNYESSHGKFPSDICDPNGNPLLSWRVSLLPFIEGQEGLYEQFELAEPWDSENNRPLLDQMPEFFQSTGTGVPPNTCNLLGVSGPGTLFGGKGLVMSHIRDGSSNTIAIVEVNPDRAVPWTQPADWVHDPHNPFDGLGTIRPTGFTAGFIDGSVQNIKRSMDPDTWKALLTIAGGEAVGNRR